MTTSPVRPLMGKRRTSDVHGWVVIDKPAGVTSAQAVAVVRRATGAKAGHGGTLDPLATGILPIALGEATKTIAVVVDGEKLYRFTVRWGERRDTDDAEGAVIEESAARPTETALRDVLPRFSGDIQQVPPRYSAVKVAGQRAYALARAEAEFTLAPRPVTIHHIDLADAGRDHATFVVRGGKGLYMRSLARDIAEAVGTVGHITALRRLAVGQFTEKDALSLEYVEACRERGDIGGVILSVGSALAGIPALTLTDAEAQRIQHGQPVAVLPVARRSCLLGMKKDMVVCAMAKGQPVALARIHGGEIRPVRVLNL